MAGIDVKVQKKTQGQFYGELIERRRTDGEKEQEKWVPNYCRLGITDQSYKTFCYNLQRFKFGRENAFWAN